MKTIPSTVITFLIDQEQSSGIYLFQNQVGLSPEVITLDTTIMHIYVANLISKFLLSLAVELGKIGYSKIIYG